MLLEELPAEISFHVPESYHKRIIGVGGRTIQRIMKKFGVFVKFFNEGGSGDEDNVVARTPAKNAINLENLKVAVLEMVSPKVSPSLRWCGGNRLRRYVYRIKISSRRRWLSPDDIIGFCLERRVSLSKTLRARPVREW